MSNSLQLTFNYLSTNISSVSGLSGQAIAYSGDNQSLLSTGVGVTATAVSYAEGFSELAGTNLGKLSGAGNLLGMVQVGRKTQQVQAFVGISSWIFEESKSCHLD